MHMNFTYPTELLGRRPAQAVNSFAGFHRARIEELPFGTVRKHGAGSLSLLALKPVRAPRHTSRPDLGSGADVAQAACEHCSTNTTTTQEVTK